jgi:phosphatidylglycerophosphate synthase
MALPTAFLVGPLASVEPGEVPVARQLRALGFDVIDAAGENFVARLGTSPPGPVALVDRRYIGHLHALRRAVCDERPQILAGPGTLAVAPLARADLVAILKDAPASVRSGPAADPAATERSGQRGVSHPAARDRPGVEVDVADLADALADTIPVTRLDPAPLVAGIADTAAERSALEARVAAVDEESIRFAGAAKSGDTAFTTFVVRPYSAYVARWLARLGVTPNQVTALSFVVGLLAGVLAATGTRSGYIAAALVFHASFVLDCVDGDLARYSVRFSRLGARLDLTADRVKEYALFAGLALGVAQSDASIWWLAATAMAVQTVRHQMHFGYDTMTAGPEPAPTLTRQVRARLGGGPWKVWLRRAALLPQGERSALICLLMAFTTPRIVFVVLLVVGVLAAAYGFLGRLMRSLRRLHRPWSKSAGQALGTMVDVGPVGWLVHHTLPGRSLPAPLTTLIALVALAFSLTVIPVVGGSWLIVGALWYALLVGFASQQPLNGWADWVLPPSFRAAEYALAITLAAVLAPAALPVAFCYVAVTAFHHYDTVYRLHETGTVPPRWLIVATGGHDCRMLVLALLAWGGASVLHVGMLVLTIGLAVVFIVESAAATFARPDTPGSVGSGRAASAPTARAGGDAG